MNAALVALVLTLNQAPPTAGPAWAIEASLADLQTVPPELRPHTRYLWALDQSKETWAAVSLALNASLSRSPFLVTPLDLHGGRLIRLDLSQMSISEAHARNLYAVYDSLAKQERVFYIQEDELVDTKTIYTDARGRRFSGRWDRKSIVHPKIFAGYSSLANQTGSPVPLMTAEWFCTKALSTLEGGCYYKFRGLRTLDGKAVFTLNQYLQSRGADENAVQRLGSDERAAMIKSGVTGKPRRIDVFRGGGVRPSVGTGLVSITHDVSDAQTKIANDPIANLLDLTSAASEAILEVSNGFHEFTLWNNSGELQDEVPPDIANDSTIPEPYTQRLQPAVGCIRCHGPQEGWKPFENDVQRIASGDLSIWGDLSRGSKAFDATIVNRLLGLYGGDLADPLRLGRNSYTHVTFMATGGLSVPQAAEATAQVWVRHEYTLVDAAAVLSTLGVETPPGIDAAKMLRATVPAVVGREDPLIDALHKGLGIQRRQFERIWPEILRRAQ